MLPGVLESVSVLPWVMLLLMLPMLLVRRPRLSKFAPPPAESAPLVSVIVPARNEAVNIGVCVASLLNSVYARFEIIVVDDNSEDGTADIVRILAEHSDGRLKLVDGAPLPAGWLGKPWACWQGARHARGDLLLFTDADTRHDEVLLGHAVGAMQARDASLVTVLPRQLMIGLWERLVLPHIFAMITLRFHNLERVNHTSRPRDVIANGQFMLVRRAAYEEIGGHEALRYDVVEDQRMAQRLVEAGHRLLVAHGENLMETRMYRSLAAIREGWSKNLALGSRRAAPDWAAPAVPWVAAVLLLALWALPPAVLAASLWTPIGIGFKAWSLTATALSLMFWVVLAVLMRIPPLFALGYPVGAVLAALLFIRSALRGTRIEWKGRHYDTAASPVAAAAGPVSRDAP